MGLVSWLFGERRRGRQQLPPEMKRFFDNMAAFVADETAQNNSYPPFIRQQVVDGVDADELPLGAGEFGRSKYNPIPVNGMIGELIYLSRLKTRHGQRLLYHRLGSIGNVDVFETVSIDGWEWDVLFLSMYHPRKSRKTPTGYTIATFAEQSMFYGTNRLVSSFPLGLQDAIAETTQDIFDVPIPPPQVREAEENIDFIRPDDHRVRVHVARSAIQGQLVSG